MAGADRIVEFRPPSIESESAADRASRLKTEVERLSRLPTVEWMFYLDDTATKYGIESAKLKAIVEAVIKETEKKAREDRGELRRREDRAEKQRTTAKRESERKQEANDDDIPPRLVSIAG